MPIESVGKRDPALAAAIKAGKPPEVTQWEYVVGRRPLKVGDETRQPGDPIPEAASWPRLESWLRSGAVVQRQPTTLPANEERAAAKPPSPAPRPPARDDDDEPRRPVLRPRNGASE